MPEQDERLIAQANLLISRLERLSADSTWAHRASGVRGALLKDLSALENDPFAITDRNRLQANLEWGFWLLERAARELIE